MSRLEYEALVQMDQTSHDNTNLSSCFHHFVRGTVTPHTLGFVTLPDGVIISAGHPVSTVFSLQNELRYNMIVVPDPSQITIRYIVIVKLAQFREDCENVCF